MKKLVHVLLYDIFVNTLFRDYITIIWDENIVYFFEWEKKNWTNNTFVYLIFINKLSWYHPKISYKKTWTVFCLLIYFFQSQVWILGKKYEETLDHVLSSLQLMYSLKVLSSKTSFKLRLHEDIRSNIYDIPYTTL